jgi:nucleolar MIF4G domain-containing protein 1
LACALCTAFFAFRVTRLAESNLQAICRDILTLYETEGRRLVADAVSAGLLAAVAEGPRATEQFAAVAAVFVGGLAAGARAQDVSARFLEMLVARLQQVRLLSAVLSR